MATRVRYPVSLDDSGIVIDTPYDADEVAATKRLTGARWDRVQRVWRVPLTSLDQVREFATKFGHDLSPEILTMRVAAPVADRVIERDGDGWSVAFKYDPVMVTEFKSGVPSARWDKKVLRWRVPGASAPMLLSWAIHAKFPVPDELRDYADRLDSSNTELRYLSEALDADIEVRTAMPLKHYQLAGVAYATKARRCFIADEMGTGKTAQAIATLMHADAFPAVVVCPATLTINWENEVRKFAPHLSTLTVSGRTTYEIPEADITIVGWSVLSDWQSSFNPRSLVFDESHYAKNPQANRTKAAVKLAKRVPSDGFVLLLTGTPIINRPIEFASQLDIINRLRDFGGRRAFAERYCGAFTDKWGRWNTAGASHLVELNHRLRGIGYIRRTKDQVMSELPEVLHQPITVEGDAHAYSVYCKAEADIIAYLVERARQLALEMGTNPSSAAVRARLAAEKAETLVRLMTLRRLAARTKFGALQEWMESRIDAEQKVIIAAHHRDVVDELAGKYGGLKIQGGMSVADVEEAKYQFQHAPYESAPAIVLSIEAGKTGHTLTAAQDVVFVELPWSPGDLDQTIARAHRIGQRGSVLATYLLTRGTVDLDIFGLVQDKRAVVNAATDGVDGVSDFSVVQGVIDALIQKSPHP